MPSPTDPKNTKSDDYEVMANVVEESAQHWRGCVCGICELRLTAARTLRALARALAKSRDNTATQWGVWCPGERAWASGTIGTRAHAEAELPHWQSGERAAVDPSAFSYEVRPVLPPDVVAWMEARASSPDLSAVRAARREVFEEIGHALARLEIARAPIEDALRAVAAIRDRLLSPAAEAKRDEGATTKGGG